MLTRLLKPSLATFLLLTTTIWPASANDHGGGGGGPTAQNFTVNLRTDSGGERFLSMDIMFAAGTPEADHEVSILLPRIRHGVILLLSDKKEAELRTTEGKIALAEEIQHLANKVIHEDEEDGVKEVLYQNFLIQ